MKHVTELRYDPINNPKLDGRVVECPTCNGLFADSQVVESPATVSQDHDHMLVVPCRFFCSHCNHIVTWLARADLATGKRTRTIVSRPGLIKNQGNIDQFLRRFPHAAEADAA